MAVNVARLTATAVLVAVLVGTVAAIWHHAMAQIDAVVIGSHHH